MNITACIAYMIAITLNIFMCFDSEARADVRLATIDSAKHDVRLFNNLSVHKDTILSTPLSVDYAPILVFDTLVYYVSNRNGSIRRTEGVDTIRSHDIWYCTVFADAHNGRDKPVNLASINTHVDEGTLTMADDGRAMHFTLCNWKGGFGSCDVYRIELTEAGTNVVTNLGPTVNTSFWDAQPSVSPDGSSLFFTSNRPSGNADRENNFDIWYAEWDFELNQWQKPKKLGKTINTSKDEFAPCADIDGVTLYFSSKGHKDNIGGFDLYRTRRTGTFDEDGNEIWSTPEHLPEPINSQGDDCFITIPAHGRFLLFSSDRDGTYDIFRAEMQK